MIYSLGTNIEFLGKSRGIIHFNAVNKNKRSSLNERGPLIHGIIALSSSKNQLSTIIKIGNF